MARLQALHSRHLLTGVLHCAVCGQHFIARPAHKRKTGQRYYYYGCSFHSRRGDTVCGNSTYLPLAAIEQELLDVLVNTILTPTLAGVLLAIVNARLRAQATAARPRLQELKAALARVERGDYQLHPGHRERRFRVSGGGAESRGNPAGHPLGRGGGG